ncbi:MAG: hypothetical protein ACQXXH_03250 [Candidatus Bathyarchaeia archaeon]|jgi:hypothetical protein|nr:hypothetical protein [Candidatus Bathyarchaeota archaeon A05DMB-4]MDH7594758.1 hypothetical protein [Candidatus Bathyarchaeota archaeon]
MYRRFDKNMKALSTIALVILLLLSAIIGGVLSYLWTMGFYLSLKEKIPEKNTVSIVDVYFPPQNATLFNVTVLNPSFSPDEFVEIESIAYSVKDEGTLHYATNVLPTLPFSLSRGQSQTFSVRTFWSSLVNRTLIVSVFVKNGIGSTSAAVLPYSRLLVANVDFNPILGVSNFTVTLRNDNLSATHLNVTKIWIDEYEITNYTKPSLPFALSPGESKTFNLNYSWASYATIGGSHNITVRTLQGYFGTNATVVPRLAFTVQDIAFNPADTMHFNVTVKNNVSTNTPLNVTKIEARMQNGTVVNVTPSLNSSNNGVLGNSTATFTCNWNWTSLRNNNTIVTVYMLQGVKESGQKRTPLAAMLSIPEEPVFADTDRFLVTVKNSPYSIKTATITKITVTFENGTETSQNLITLPLSGPYSVGIGETTMFGCSWSWTTYLNKTVNINVYTDEGFATFRVIRTPISALNYTVYLNVTSTVFNTANTSQFEITLHNDLSSTRSANITRISILLANGTEVNATSTSLPLLLGTDSTATITCQWDWTALRGKNIVIRVYTDEGLRTIYIKTLP